MTNLESVKISDGLNSRERRTLKYHLKEVVNRIGRKRMERLVLRALEKRGFHENRKSAREYDKLVRQAGGNKFFAALLQLYLRFKGYYSEKFKIDGIFGNGSKEALKDYMNLSHHRERRHHSEKITSKELKHLSPSLRAIWRKYGPKIKKVARIAHVPVSYIFKMGLAEVGKDVDSWNSKIDYVNPSTGAWGLTQVIPGTEDAIVKDAKKYYGINLKKYKRNKIIYSLLLGAFNLKMIARKKHITFSKAIVYHNTGENYWNISKDRILNYIYNNPAIARKMKINIKKAYRYSRNYLLKKYFRAAYIYYNKII